MRHCQVVLRFCSIPAMDWDDLRFVLAVARAGSAHRAARDLKVNQTTVMRRIAHLEADIGASLFEAKQTGQTLTPLGQSVAAAAEKIESEVVALENTIAAQQRVLSGSVRFTSNESLTNRIVTPSLKIFRKQYPGITVELVTDDRRLDLARGEADVALRAGSRPEGSGIVAQRLPDTPWTVYCSRAYAEEHGAPANPDELKGHAIVSIEGPLTNLPAFVWFRQQALRSSIGTRSSSLTNLASAVKGGLGIAPLPCVIGDAEADLVRCFPPIAELTTELWLVIRADVRQAPHVRAFVDFLAAHMRARL
jgi:DNA-binding transcriptional LysR family regulator